MSKTLSAEAEHRPYFTTKRMALIGVMTAVTCILGPLSIPASIQPGSDFLYKPCYLSGGICAGNESLHDQLPDLYAAWHGGHSGIFRLYGRSR